ncbi:MAG: AAA family ATPase [Wolinella sp.]
MISRLLIKNSPVFKEESIELSHGFNVFSGASGAGKSVLMESILALFGLRECNAEVVEASIEIPTSLEEWGVDAEGEAIFSILKKDKARYFINSQSLSKRKVAEISAGFIKHVSIKEAPELESSRLLALVDSIVLREDSSFGEILGRYKELWRALSRLKDELKELKRKESQIEELKEFLHFEIDKIAKIAPKAGEYDSLLAIKKNLSKREKIEESMLRAERFLDGASAVDSFLELSGNRSELFTQAIDELHTIIEIEREKLSGLDDIEPEGLLTRIEKLSELNRRYGSEEEALNALELKRKELEKYENITTRTDELERECAELEQECAELAQEMSTKRKEVLPCMSKELNNWLDALLLSSACFEISTIPLCELGADRVGLRLRNANMNEVSSGEFNRLRLALLALEASHSKQLGVLILDEIDANLSGEESEGVAKVLSELSSSYQVLAISHQPHMPSYASRHFLVKKGEESSTLISLDKEGQIAEIARMVSGSEITQEALEFARKRLER